MAGAEEQEYRDKIRKDKTAVYDHYLWRKLLMAAYAKHVDYMMCPDWDARFSAKIEQYALLHHVPSTSPFFKIGPASRVAIGMLCRRGKCISNFHSHNLQMPLVYLHAASMTHAVYTITYMFGIEQTAG